MDGESLSVVAFATGAVALAAIVAPLWFASVRLRRRYLPAWEGPPAVLAEVVTGLSLLIVVVELLGTVGLFRRWAVAAACVAVGVVVAARVHPPERPAVRAAEEPARGPVWPVAAGAAVVATAVLVGQYVGHVLTVLSMGVVDFDSLDYHLPHAALFAQRHVIWHLEYLSPGFPTNLHPYNVELLHATGMVAFGRDLLTPLVNLAFLGLVLLAGWCAGRPFGKAPVTLVGVAVAVAAPILGFTQPATALTDLPSLALFTASVALLLQPGGSRARLVVAGAAAGLAMGTKLTVLAPVAVLTVGLVLIARKAWREVLVAWGAPLAITGGYWFVRNLVATGSPLPSLRLGPIPSPEFEAIEERGFRITDYLTDADIWRDWIIPGLSDAMGWWWWAVLGLAAIGTVLALVRGAPLLKVLAAAAVVAALAYLLTPTSAGGPPDEPLLFAVNLRYLFPSIVLGLVLLPLAPGLASRRAQAALLAAYLVVGAVTVLGGGRLRGLPAGLDAWADQHRPASAAAVLLVVVGALAASRWSGRRPDIPRGAAAGALVCGALAVVAVGWAVQHRHYTQRWQYTALFDWGDELADERVGIQGFLLKYPFYGRDLSNRVDYVGRPGPRGEFHEIGGCPEWRRSLAERELDYLLVAEPTRLGTDALSWTEGDPSAEEVETFGTIRLFRLRGRPDPEACD